jgi:predicted nuclease with TOPRIM domain
MATGNGHDPATVQMVEILGQIRTELAGLREDTNARFAELRGDVQDLRGEVAAFKTEVRNELTDIRNEIADTNEELVALRGEVHELRGELKGPLEARVAKTEAAIVELRALVFKPTGT